jgi:hypothetical protein
MPSETPTLGLIALDDDNQSQVFVATRAVRNVYHPHDAIAPGAEVVFWENCSGIVVLTYADSNAPTNGDEYLAFPSIGDAERFAEGYGLVPSAGSPATTGGTTDAE